MQLALERAQALDTRPRIGRIELILPFPPSVNNLYRTFVARGRVMRAKTTIAKEYDDAARKTIGEWLAQRGCRPPAPPYRLTLVAYPPKDGRRHDASNLIKAPEDALMGVILGDDDHVVELHVEKREPDGWPRLVAVLEGSEG